MSPLFSPPIPLRHSAVLLVRSLALSAVSFLTIAGALYAAPPTKVAYTVTVSDTAHKLFHVTARAEGVTDESVSFALPAWSPGWYVLTNAYKNISEVSATGDDGKPLPLTTVDKLTWKVMTNGAKNVTVSYSLKALDQDPDAVGTPTGTNKDYGFFSPYLDDKNGFVPGPASLLYVVDGKQAPCSVTYKVPTGWKVASANEPTADPNTFAAPDYDTLVDQPGELGTFARFDKTVSGVPFSVILIGSGDLDTKPWVSACWKIAEAGIKVFGRAPFPRYIFHFRFVENSPAMMGLEHLNSTVISMPPNVLASLEPDALSIVAHEFIHAWNVKRIRPEKLGPFDYTQAVRVKDLWWSEGVTDYYAPRVLVEAGLVGQEFWRSYMSRMVTELETNPSRKRVTLETASLKAWEGRSDGFDGLSYYNKGLVVGLLLDIEMRRHTANKVGLDDLMKALWQESEDTHKGFQDGEIERLASQLTGKDMKPFFEKALRSTEELPLAEVLGAAGLKLMESSFTFPDIGIDESGIRIAGTGIQLDQIRAGGPAEKAGLKKGDIVSAIDGEPIMKAMGTVFKSPPGQVLSLTVDRAGKPMKVRLTLGEGKQQVFDVAQIPTATMEQKAIYDGISGVVGSSGRVQTATAEKSIP